MSSIKFLFSIVVLVVSLTSVAHHCDAAESQTRSQFVRWGARTCPIGSTLVYEGIAAGNHYQYGGGYNTLCLHPSPQFPTGYTDANNNGALLYGTEYENTGAIDKSHDLDAACAVCSANTVGDVYVQWGRSNTCSNSHTKMYSGYVMATHYTHSKSEYVCVDPAHEQHRGSSSADNNGHLWYTTETEAGSMDESLYPPNREVGCTVCLAPKTVYVQWGALSCSGGASTLYSGIAAGSYYEHGGSGANTLCLHNLPEYPKGFSDGNQNGALLYGTEYENTGAIDKNHDRDAACSVCMVNTEGDVYVQWGRSGTCSNAHSKLYSGLVMSERYTHNKGNYVCVDSARAQHPQADANDHNGNMWYTVETEAGSMDEFLYPPNREVGCTVCLAPKTVYVQWGARSCSGGASTLYTGIAAGSHYNHRGSGANTLCLHSTPQYPAGYSDGDQNGGLLYGTEYENTGAIDQSLDLDAACAVCTLPTVGDVYVQWGRSKSCSNTHTTLYTGFVMAKHYSQACGEFVCVDAKREQHARSSTANDNGNLWYTAETEHGSMDEAIYPNNREVGCSVCVVTPFTLAPTKSPTNSPTKPPTLRPTLQPTLQPTQPPTRKPTRTPTTNPTEKPTFRPTKPPTQHPTTRPTIAPSFHLCDSGEHGCDKTQFGMCVPTIGGGYRCDCVKTHQCKPDCISVGHVCEVITASPTQAPTKRPTTSPPNDQRLCQPYLSLSSPRAYRQRNQHKD